jgi:Fe-S cluster assembly iron-binding protein IscA
MLQVTTRAAAILNQERADRGIPDDFGLRVRQDRSDSVSSLQLEFTPGPAPGDQVGEEQGVRLFVAPDLADVLASQAIDASESSGLVIREQGEVDP